MHDTVKLFAACSFARSSSVQQTCGMAFRLLHAAMQTAHLHYTQYLHLSDHEANLVAAAAACSSSTLAGAVSLLVDQYPHAHFKGCNPTGMANTVLTQNTALHTQFLQTAYSFPCNRSTEQVHFEDIVRASSDGEGTPFLDTYSLRNLVMAAPCSVQLLSAMHVSPEKYLQRCAIVAPSGEECVLTFSAALQEVQECQ
jgi:hypothetical protein